ncbi:sulfatase [Alicyclobacillus fodiniaquatilis]|uniref:Sulfatase n=1 Tax=Alicyclobacillus fodiniaquatilis TaxID=1661150 RepID=A0ABW4JNE9_9BACL
MARPNILLITSDQQHWDTIGAFNREISTPNLDRLVKEGTTFKRAYCPNPTCTPSRSSIITGLYPSQHGAWTLGTKLSEDKRTVGDVLMEAGYRTSLIGKAHFQPLQGTEAYPSLESYPTLQDLDFWREFSDPFYGFDHVELARNHTNEAHVGQHYALWLEEKGFTDWRKHFLPPTGTMDKAVRRTWGIPEEYHYDAWIAERTNAMLEQYQNDEENFFLWASFFDPHPDYFVPENWVDMYNPDDLTIPSGQPGEHEQNPPHFQLTQQAEPDFSAYRESGFGCHGFHSHVHDPAELKKDVAIYYAMISLMDKYIGKILDKLDELGLAENTIVIFASDHGHFFGQHGLIAKGAFHYEDMIKVPFLARYPGHIPAAKTSDRMQSLVDFAPTVLSLAGISVPHEMTGVDQSRVWLGQQDMARDHILCENHHEPTSIHLKTYVDARYKITVYYGQTYGELYDLEADPNEFHNLWDDEQYAELKAQLLLKYIWAELGKESMWMPRIASA